MFQIQNSSAELQDQIGLFFTIVLQALQRWASTSSLYNHRWLYPDWRRLCNSAATERIFVQAVRISMSKKTFSADSAKAHCSMAAHICTSIRPKEEQPANASFPMKPIKSCWISTFFRAIGSLEVRLAKYDQMKRLLYKYSRMIQPA